jgi:drug/metabolite transporter (DMT)-like permease
MKENKSNFTIMTYVLSAIFLWGGNNVAVKYLTKGWTPVFIGWSRILVAGLLIFAMMRWTSWFGKLSRLTPSLKRGLWLKGSLSFALFILVFNWAVKLTSASHVALYLSAVPVWALLWDERPAWTLNSLRAYTAALFAMGGVFVLLQPSLKNETYRGIGEVLGFSASLLWTNHTRQCRFLSEHLTGIELSAHNMIRAAAWLTPFVLWEFTHSSQSFGWDLIGVQTYCVFGGSILAFALWNGALRHWPASKVLLFNNFISISTMVWAYIFLGEPLTIRIWISTAFIALAVGIAQWREVWAFSSKYYYNVSPEK